MPIPSTPCLALTMGDPSGIGPELTLKAWLARKSRHLPAFVYLGDAAQLFDLSATLGLEVPVAEVADSEAARGEFNHRLPILTMPLPSTALPGTPNADHVAAIVSSLEHATSLAEAGDVAGIVTNPIHKKTMWQGGFAFPGHTEYLAARFAATGRTIDTCMMLIAAELRVVPVTIHIPLKDVSQALHTDSIISIARLVAKALTADFAVSRPKVALAALNPHGGEDGGLGHEEHDIIEPAIDQLLRSGIDVEGPFPADTLFAAHVRRRFDAIICMYHDQALIPLKTVDFDNGVNVTLGLPIVRTSPDHGTAHDIAGKGVAKADSLIMALKTARTIAENRMRQ